MNHHIVICRKEKQNFRNIMWSNMQFMLAVKNWRRTYWFWIKAKEVNWIETDRWPESEKMMQKNFPCQLVDYLELLLGLLNVYLP